MDDEVLGLLGSETHRLLATVAQLPPESMGRPSRCRDWTRGHVVTHLARNADALGNLVAWASTGTRHDMYASAEARAADIEAGAARGHHEQYADLVAASHRLADQLADLSPKQAKAKLELRGGRRVRGRDLAALRLREVVFHHVDLVAGYSFDDAPPALVNRFLDEAIERAGEVLDLPALHLRADTGRTWFIPGVRGPITEVAGSPGGLLLWLSRGQTDAVYTDSAFPLLPDGL